MVNVGRPSRDCLHCRRRKLRCDLRPGTCGQCRRAKLPCTGYRDPAELIFRDESAAAKQKVLSRAGRSKITTTTTAILPLNTELSRHEPRDTAISHVTHLPSPFPVSLQPSISFRARAAFFAHYVFGLSRSYDTLPSLYSSVHCSSPLSAAVDAASLAFLSFRYPSTTTPSSPSTLARQRYSTALQALNTALADPNQRAHDTTLQAVLLLDLYEKLTHGPRSSRGWLSHVHGALSLLHIRGKDKNFSTHNARRLALRLVVTLVISCAAAGVRVPREVQDVRKGLKKWGMVSENDPKWMVTEVVCECVALGVDVKEGKFRREEVRERVRELDGKFGEIETHFPEAFGFVTVGLREGVEQGCRGLIYGDGYDVYRDHFYTQLWNVVRTMRLILVKMRRDFSVGSTRTCQETDDQHHIDALILPVLSSIPQFTLPHARPDNQIPFTPLQTLQCYTLLAPLYLAAQMSPRDDVRSWAVGVMEYMAEQGRMRTARTVADMLRTNSIGESGEDGDGRGYWEVYAVLGSYAFSA